MKLTIGFSPCPNDTFIFDALVNGKIDTGDYTFEVVMEDVEQLNKWAFEKKLNITKLSYHAYLFLMDNYSLLESGSALGQNCGPLLISKKGKDIPPIEECRIAIPGEFTTAHFLLKFAFPNIQFVENYLFSEIEQALNDDKVDLGVIIHENRFTYADRGFEKIVDLGEFWENKTNVHIPLGGIVIESSLGAKVESDINRFIKESILYAYKNPGKIDNFILDNAQEMEPHIIREHIKLYVNEFSISLGGIGHKAVDRFIKEAKKMEIV